MHAGQTHRSTAIQQSAHMCENFDSVLVRSIQSCCVRCMARPVQARQQQRPCRRPWAQPLGNRPRCKPAQLLEQPAHNIMGQHQYLASRRWKQS